MSDNNNSDWKDKELGVLWKTQSKTSDTKYLRGKITVNGEEIQVMVFPTKDKRNEKSPDFVIYAGGDRAASSGNGGGAPKSAYNRSGNTGGGNGGGSYPKRSYPPRNNNNGGGGGGQPSQEFL